ncbi:hypothetical protein WHR41_06163 [Cladosporium halotolerans]|uniref:Uncharacterized protein n=1 Tax=Cladosporium halotolerans TaxID=1052096 RepID=A0AB34KPN5_9PEZI
MKYTMIAAALIGAVVAMPAAPAAYGESENVYGTEVAAQQTSAAPAPTSTCTDEAENAVPYTSAAQSAVVETSAPAQSAPAYSAPAYGGMTSSASEASPEMPKDTAAPSMPAGYSAPAAGSSAPAMSAPAYGASSMGASEASPEMPKDTAAASMPAGYSAPASNGAMTETIKATSSVMVANTATIPASMETDAAMGSASMPAASAPAASAPAAQPYGSAVVPGSAPTAAPYPQGGSPSGMAAASGTVGAAAPSGTGSMGVDYKPFEGAASSVNVAGLFAGVGAIAAFFL